ncbi:hypothetical protein [Bradyrhizobium sacchari]|uniref:hypothetical protein n=1 Tax=Bradyrhizobium sacchari TaxID=1399419 RepID=UPI001FD8A5F0|nr:hypothetical protein [Bradyrhizobium sacchari]
MLLFAVCTDRRGALCAAEAGTRRRASGAVTVTDGRFCALLCAVDCASDACGTKTQADAVANTADRSIPRLFNAPPQTACLMRHAAVFEAAYACGDAYVRAREFPN